MYQKEIIYMNLLENEIKVSCVGYLKSEKKQDRYRLELQVKNIPTVLTGSFPIRLQDETGWQEADMLTIREGCGKWTGMAAGAVLRAEILLSASHKIKGQSKNVQVAEKPAADKGIAEKPIADKATIDRAIAEKPMKENAMADRTMTDRAIAEMSIADKPIEERATTDKAMADRAMAEKPMADRAMAEKSMADRAMTEKSIADKTIVNKAMSDKAIANKAIVEKAIADTPMSDKAIANTPTAGQNEKNIKPGALHNIQKETAMPETNVGLQNLQDLQDLQGKAPEPQISANPGEGRKEAEMIMRAESVAASPNYRSRVRPMIRSEQGRRKPEHTPLYENKWEQLLTTYEQIHPYGDNRIYVKLQPKDFIILRENYQHLVNNSFLLHGFYNYRYLILGKEKDFYLGVPGVFYEREKMVALMFGFEAFECEGGEAEEGKFGYYLRKVEI